MVAASTTPNGEHVATADGRVVMHGVSWAHYEVMLALRGEKGSPRMTYLEGALELMSPSRYHERIRRIIGHCVELYALENGIVIGAYGQWTLKDSPEEAGAEADECYIFGADQKKDRPDLAIEVVWTSGGIGKLEVYRRLRVGEVWIWKDGRIDIHVLAGDNYQTRDRSACLPDLDLRLIESVVDQPTLTGAIGAFRTALRATAPTDR